MHSLRHGKDDDEILHGRTDYGDRLVARAAECERDGHLCRQDQFFRRPWEARRSSAFWREPGGRRTLGSPSRRAARGPGILSGSGFPTRTAITAARRRLPVGPRGGERRSTCRSDSPAMAGRWSQVMAEPSPAIRVDRRGGCGAACRPGLPFRYRRMVLMFCVDPWDQRPLARARCARRNAAP